MSNFGKKLQEQTSGVRLSISKLGLRKTMSKDQVFEVANLFNADDRSVSGSKAIINRKHELIAPITSLLAETSAYIRDRTIDYPEQGLRLCRLDQVESLVDAIEVRRQQLSDLLFALAADWGSVIAEARERLGDLFNPSDYPSSPKLQYSISLTFPEVQPDKRLLTLNPALYAEQQKIIAAKFEEAVVIAEAAAAHEIQKLLANLAEKLKPGEDGSKKIMKGSTIANIAEFVELFKSKTIGSNEGLEALMEKVSGLANGLDPAELRKASAEDRQKVAGELDAVLEEVAGLIETMPMRALDLE